MTLLYVNIKNTSLYEWIRIAEWFPVVVLLMTVGLISVLFMVYRKKPLGDVGMTIFFPDMQAVIVFRKSNEKTEYKTMSTSFLVAHSALKSQSMKLSHMILRNQSYTWGATAAGFEHDTRLRNNN